MHEVIVIQRRMHKEEEEEVWKHKDMRKGVMKKEGFGFDC